MSVTTSSTARNNDRNINGVRGALDEAGEKFAAAEQQLRTPDDSPRALSSQSKTTGQKGVASTSDSPKMEAESFPRSYPVSQRGNQQRQGLTGWMDIKKKAQKALRRNLVEEFQESHGQHGGLQSSHGLKKNGYALLSVFVGVACALLLTLCTATCVVMITTPEMHESFINGVSKSPLGEKIPGKYYDAAVWYCHEVKYAQKAVWLHTETVVVDVQQWLDQTAHVLATRWEDVKEEARVSYLTALKEKPQALAVGTALVAVSGKIGADVKHAALVGMARIPKVADPLVGFIKKHLPSIVIQTAEKPVIMHTVVQPAAVLLSTVTGLGLALLVITGALMLLKTKESMP